MDPYLIGAFMNECSVIWRSIEGFSNAVDYVRSLESGITMSNNILNATSSLCNEVNKILQKPTRLLMFFNANDWIRLLRGGFMTFMGGN